MRPNLAASLLALLAFSLPLTSGRAICPSSDTTACKSLPGDEGSLQVRGISFPKTPKPKDPFRDPSHSPDSDTPSNPFRDPSGSPEIPSSPSGSWQNLANQGNIKFDDAGLEAQRAKGATMITDLDNAIKNNGGNGGKTTSMNEAGYRGQGTLSDPPVTDKYLADFPIDISKDWRGDRITRKDADNEILLTYEDAAQGTIVVKNSRNKEHDPNGALSWTAMVMSNWRAAGDVKNLKYMVRDNIQPIQTVDGAGVKLDTTAAIRGAYDNMGADKTKNLDLSPSSSNADEVASFQLVAAQTHVARVYQMLKDYRTELGDKTISKLTVMTPENASKSYQYSIVITFGPGK